MPWPVLRRSSTSWHGALAGACACAWLIAGGCAGAPSEERRSGSGGSGSGSGGAPSGSGGAGGSSRAPGAGGAAGGDGRAASGGTPGGGAAGANGSGASGTGGKASSGGGPGPGGGTTGGAGGGAGGAADSGSHGGAAGGAGGPAPSGPIGVIAGALATGIAWTDDQGQPVNAHGGGINREGDTFYLSGEFFVYKAGAGDYTNNSFKAFAMYSTKDFMTWKLEGKILPQQPSGELGPNRIGERPHIIKCPATGEFVLIAHAGSIDYQTDKEAVYATSATINGNYAYKGPLADASGALIVHSDMSAYVDGNTAYVVTESGHLYELARDCHSWSKHTSYAAMANMESPTVFKAGGTYFWIMSSKTGWRANDNQYATAPAMTGPWTNQGLIAPTGERTWLSQSTCVLPIVGSSGTVYLYQGDHWFGTEDTSGATAGKNNSLATYVLQPIVVNGAKISLPRYLASWKLDVGAGTWTE